MKYMDSLQGNQNGGSSSVAVTGGLVDRNTIHHGTDDHNIGQTANHGNATTPTRPEAKESRHVTFSTDTDLVCHNLTYLIRLSY